MNRWYFASCARGLEPLLAEEITALGGHTVREDPAGVSFRGAPSLGPRLCLWSRVASRVFEELQRGRIRNADGLYAVAARVPWWRWISPGQTFAITAAVSGPVVRDARYAALKVKDALVDQLRERRGTRPDVDPSDPDVPIRVTVRGTVATLSRDLAGVSLHKRGYRPAAQHRSPLNESLAAGLLRLADWNGQLPLCDPLCGSATFLIEAAFMHGDRAPGLGRRFAFERWSDLDGDAWEAAKADAARRWARGRATLPPQFFGNDRHPGAVHLARRAIQRAGLEGAIRIEQRDIAAYIPPSRPAFVVTNPPYGKRIGRGDTGAQTWTALGRWLREQAPGATAWVLSGDPALTRHLRLRATRRLPVRNGPLSCRWLRYPLRSIESID